MSTPSTTPAAMARPKPESARPSDMPEWKGMSPLAMFAANTCAMSARPGTSRCDTRPDRDSASHASSTTATGYQRPRAPAAVRTAMGTLIVTLGMIGMPCQASRQQPPAQGEQQSIAGKAEHADGDDRRIHEIEAQACLGLHHQIPQAGIRAHHFG